MHEEHLNMIYIKMEAIRKLNKSSLQLRKHFQYMLKMIIKY